MPNPGPPLAGKFTTFVSSPTPSHDTSAHTRKRTMPTDEMEWEHPDVTAQEEYLERFDESYQADGDFKKARGALNSPRYHALHQLNKKDAFEYDEPHRGMIQKLQLAWETWSYVGNYFLEQIIRHRSNGYSPTKVWSE